MQNQQSKLTLARTDSANAAFRNLVQLLDEHLTIVDKDDHDFYHQFNGIVEIKHVVLALDHDQAVACGAIKRFDSDTVEVKRMFTREQSRGRGIAVQVLNELETWAGEMGYQRLILETGVRQPYAIRLYEKSGYQRMAENYPPYQDVENSVCLEKPL